MVDAGTLTVVVVVDALDAVGSLLVVVLSTPPDDVVTVCDGTGVVDAGKCTVALVFAGKVAVVVGEKNLIVKQINKNAHTVAKVINKKYLQHFDEASISISFSNSIDMFVA